MFQLKYLVYKYYCEGVAAGQMYTYPARCWRKKRRLDNATHPRLGLYGLHLGKLSSCHLLVAYWSATFLLPTHLLLHLLQLMSLLVMIWNNLTKSISLRLSRTGCQSFFTGWNVAVFIPTGKLVLWEVERVIRFTTAGSCETDFDHWRPYLINYI